MNLYLKTFKNYAVFNGRARRKDNFSVGGKYHSLRAVESRAVIKRTTVSRVNQIRVDMQASRPEVDGVTQLFSRGGIDMNRYLKTLHDEGEL